MGPLWTLSQACLLVGGAVFSVGFFSPQRTPRMPFPLSPLERGNSCNQSLGPSHALTRSQAKGQKQSPQEHWPQRGVCICGHKINGGVTYMGVMDVLSASVSFILVPPVPSQVPGQGCHRCGQCQGHRWPRRLGSGQLRGFVCKLGGSREHFASSQLLTSLISSRWHLFLLNLQNQNKTGVGVCFLNIWPDDRAVPEMKGRARIFWCCCPGRAHS